ncbi:MAG: C4-dicarboxylate TRAP transporter substrate-binding protein [Chloroflexota bacterium]
MKTGLRWLLVAVVLALALALTSCAKATPTPAKTPAPPAAAPAAPAAAATPAPAPIKPMTLKTHTYGAAREVTAGYEWWASEVTRLTDGAIKFEHFYNESLGAARDIPDHVKAGLYDIGPMLTASYHPGKTPLWNATSLPGLTGDYVVMAKAQADISTLPELEAELKGWNAKYLFSPVTPSYEYMGKKPVRKVEDLKGLRLRTLGEQAKLISNLGGVPFGLTAPEIYEALERNTLDGVIFPWTYGFGAYGLHEVSKYAALFGLGPIAPCTCISLDTWGKLDPRVQQIMLDVAKQVPEVYRKVYDQSDEKWLPEFKKKGIEIVDFSPAERAKVKEASRPLGDAWVAEQEKAGRPGRKVLDAFLTAIAKYEKK